MQLMNYKWDIYMVNIIMVVTRYFLSHTISSLLFGCIPYPGNECSVDVDSFHTCCVKRLCKLDRKVSRIATYVQHLIKLWIVGREGAGGGRGGGGEREKRKNGFVVAAE